MRLIWSGEALQRPSGGSIGDEHRGLLLHARPVVPGDRGEGRGSAGVGQEGGAGNPGRAAPAAKPPICMVPVVIGPDPSFLAREGDCGEVVRGEGRPPQGNRAPRAAGRRQSINRIWRNSFARRQKCSAACDSDVAGVTRARGQAPRPVGRHGRNRCSPVPPQLVDALADVVEGPVRGGLAGGDSTTSGAHRSASSLMVDTSTDR